MKLEALKNRLKFAISRDNVTLLLKTTRRFNLELRREGHHLLMSACEDMAYRCASALLSGETTLTFDVNMPDYCGISPIHRAAYMLEPVIIELLLYHGASVDALCPFFLKDYALCLPLDCALVMAKHFLSGKLGCYRWSPTDSIFKLVTLICLQRFQKTLECIEMLAWNTLTFQDVFLRYAREGELEFLALLLAVACQNLACSFEEICELLSSHGHKPVIAEDKKDAIFLLLDVFKKAGNELEIYIKKDKNGVTAAETSREVARILVEAGFILSDVDTDLGSLARGSIYTSEFRTEDEDLGMEHYGKSKHRWMIYNNIKGGGLLDIESRLHELICQDNERSFFETIKRHLTSREICRQGQEFLMNCIKYEAYHCASMLMKRQTRLIFNVNRPNPYGEFPIHYAVKYSSPGMIELLLYHGARTNVQCDCVPSDPASYPPLHFALFNASHGFGIYNWTPRDFVFSLIAFICLPVNQKKLECAELLALKTKNIGGVFLRYAMEGEISFLVPLLAVAHKSLASPIRVIRRSQRFPKMEALTLLLDVFERAGELLETYIKQNKNGVSVKQISVDVKRLLTKAGFKVTSGFNVNCADSCFQVEDEDFGMEHYDTSKLRWKTYN